jgi:hypothetical protein
MELKLRLGSSFSKTIIPMPIFAGFHASYFLFGSNWITTYLSVVCV